MAPDVGGSECDEPTGTPGDVLWEVETGSSIPVQLAVAPDAGFYVGSRRAHEIEPGLFHGNAKVSRFTADGTFAWLREFLNAERQIEIGGIAATPDGGMVVALTELVYDEHVVWAKLVSLSRDGDTRWTWEEEQQHWGLGSWDAAVTSDGLVVATRSGDRVVSVGVTASGDTAWRAELPTEAWTISNVAVAREVAVAAQIADGLVLASYDAEGRELWRTQPDVTASPSSLWAELVADSSGRLYFGSISRPPQLLAFSETGALRWSKELPEWDGIKGVAASAEAVVAAGVYDGDGWYASYTPDGEPRWERRIPEFRWMEDVAFGPCNVLYLADSDGRVLSLVP